MRMERSLKDNSLRVSALLLVADAIGMWVAFYTALTIRGALIPLIGGVTRMKPARSLAELAVLLAILIFWVYRLYPGYGFTAVKELESLIKALTLVFVFLTISAYLLRVEEIKNFSRLTFLFAWIISIGVIASLRFLIRNRLSLTSYYGIPAVIYGDGPWARSVKKSLNRVRRLGWRPEKILSIADVQQCDETLADYQLAILATGAQQPVEELARVLNQQFHRVVLVREEDKFGSLWVEPVDINGQLGLQFHYHLLDPLATWTKRTMDIVGSGILLILLSPFMALMALLIVLDSRGPVFYCQERLGQNFRIYRIWKFRTMVVDADRKLREILKSDPDLRQEFERYHKLKNDPRITRVGRVLRRFSLDEISQLWNVLRGDMSLVGPRVGLPDEFPSTGAVAASILRVKPGMTGWWQVTRGADTTFERRVRMDEYYISNWSLWMDLFILMKTLWIVASGSGA